MRALQLGTLQTSSLIGRNEELEDIRTAVQADGLQVIFIKGEAGIGKTRLLNHLPDIFQDVVFADLIDLYHTDFHTISGIEKAIADGLDPDDQWFGEYRRKRKRYERLRRAGSSIEELEKLHAELAPQFVQDLNNRARDKRVILRFDTVEMMQSEEEIHPLLKQEEEIVEVRSWLTARIPELKNIVVILAGRPQGKIWDELKSALEKKGIRPSEIELKPLQESDVRSYFEDLASRNQLVKNAELNDEHYPGIHRVTGGRPLHLALVAVLLASNERLPDALLAGSDRMASQDDFKPILEQVLCLPGLELKDALLFVAWLRKGVDDALLSRVMKKCLGSKWTRRKAIQVLDGLRELPFAKTRPDSKLVFLHDEMYELMEKFFLNQDTMAEWKRYTCETAIDWYDDKIKKEHDNKRKQRLIVEQLYYRLLKDSEEGFEHYQALSDEALIGREVGFEMALRDEVLRFFLASNLLGNHRAGFTVAGRRFVRDSVSRWVQRRLRQGKYEKALNLIDNAWSHNSYPFEREGEFLFPCVLLTYRGEALAYLGKPEEAINVLKNAIERLKELKREPGTRRERIIRYMLGLAHKNLGYAYARLHKYDQAVRANLGAIDILDLLAKEGMQSAQLDAAHVQRNLAFVYSELGRLSEAKMSCDAALEEFRKLHSIWGEALTQNVYGGIEYRFHHLHRSLARCKEALKLFKQIEDRRGIGLSTLWAGRAMRKLGTAHTYERQAQGMSYLKQAEKNLSQAREIFEEINEPARLLETIAEQAKLHRDWTKLLRREGQDEKEINSHTKKAEGLFQEAIQKADELQGTTERADYRHDLADLYFILEDYDQASKWLDQAKEHIDHSCILSPGQPMTELSCSLPAHLEIMGKICTSQGHIAWARHEHMLAIEHWSLAFVYLYAFSPSANRFREEIAENIAIKLVELKPSELQELRCRCQQVTDQYKLPHNQLLVELDELIRTAQIKEQELDEAIWKGQSAGVNQG